MSLSQLAARAGVDPYFLAFSMAEYAAVGNLEDAGLAAALGTSVDVLPHVRLCRNPRADAEGFRADVERIAAKFALNRDTLVAIARHGHVVAAMRKFPNPDASEVGLVVAARDRTES